MATYDIEEIDANLDGQDVRLAIVLARFNQDIGEGLLSACTSELQRLGVAADDVRILTVPGALELPVVLSKLAESGAFDALIALGAVVRGETYHFEVVSNESARGILQVSLDYGIPIANGVLTTETDHQALERVMEKGADCARVAVELANLFKAIE